jgi:hypothetical protein
MAAAHQVGNVVKGRSLRWLRRALKQIGLQCTPHQLRFAEMGAGGTIFQFGIEICRQLHSENDHAPSPSLWASYRLSSRMTPTRLLLDDRQGAVGRVMYCHICQCVTSIG